ncbi:MAG: DUF721 domain-containing protein [Marinilabiliaceae bacterium]|nr:DUF721 domain-containing protein [Marinilabiliaceae bacterium]
MDQNSLHIKDILSQIMEQPEWSRGVGESLAVKAWGEVLGQSVVRKTSNIYIKDKVLFVTINSSIVRHELFLNKRKIIDSINEYVGSKVVSNIIFR